MGANNGVRGSGDGSGIVAVYARLSVNENGERDDSLESQCSLLVSFVEENGLGRFELFVDNDVSGTRFDRPALNRMVAGINRGEIRTVVVKDLSRLGRNNGETLMFLDFLNEKGVRLISLGDNYDSFRDDDDTIGIKTWVNEYYARDISRKVRASLRKKMLDGEFLGRPPFGYVKSKDRKNKLEVDERYRDIIRQIFELYIEGWGYRALADYVQSLGIPTPGRNSGCARAVKSDRWCAQHIRRIITNRVYCGDVVHGVREKVSFKSRKTRRVPDEKWIVTTGAHEPIVSREVFELAQQVRLKRWLEGEGRKKCKAGEPHLFAGLVVCGRCGTHHVYRKKGARPAGYICGLYNRLGRSGCTSHHVTEEKLIQCLLRDVQRLGREVPYRERLMAECMKSIFSCEGLKDKIEALEGEIGERKRQLKEAYLDKIRGVVPEGVFLEIRETLEREIDLLSGRLDRLRAELADAGRSVDLAEIGEMRPELLVPEDIERAFLEKYLRKIIVVEDGEEMSESVMQVYGLKTLPGGECGEFETGEGKGRLLIVVYDLSPVAC